MTCVFDVATFLFEYLSLNEIKNLTLVHRDILNGPVTNFIAISAHSRAPKRKDFEGPLIRDFIEKLTIKKPNLHLLNEWLCDLDLNALILIWTFPCVRATTDPPSIDLKKHVPHLKTLKIVENGNSVYCLPFFKSGFTIPDRLKLLDLSDLHISKEPTDFNFVIDRCKNVTTVFCCCCQEFTRPVWENNWTETNCSLKQ